MANTKLDITNGEQMADFMNAIARFDLEDENRAVKDAQEKIARLQRQMNEAIEELKLAERNLYIKSALEAMKVAAKQSE